MSPRHQRSATSHVTTPVRLRSWLSHHFGCLNESLLRIFQAPLTSLLTIAVLGIALALPGGLFMLTKNLLSLSGSWDAGIHITLYLNDDISDKQGDELSQSLDNDPNFSSVQFLSRTQALEEFRQMAHFDEALDKLDQNPLPSVILITPLNTLSAKQLTPVLEELKNKPEIQLVQLDLEWIKRLQAIIQTAQHGLLVIFALLALAVILVVGNTIRLEIENRRDEIVITKLFGATNAFIRRPFLYDGLWFGLFGGLFACLLILAALWILDGPIATLIELYDSEFQPIYPDLIFILSMVLLGGFLGYIGAWMAVSQHLHKIEPS